MQSSSYFITDTKSMYTVHHIAYKTEPSIFNAYDTSVCESGEIVPFLVGRALKAAALSVTRAKGKAAVRPNLKMWHPARISRNKNGSVKLHVSRNDGKSKPSIVPKCMMSSFKKTRSVPKKARAVDVKLIKEQLPNLERTSCIPTQLVNASRRLKVSFLCN